MKNIVCVCLAALCLSVFALIPIACTESTSDSDGDYTPSDKDQAADGDPDSDGDTNDIIEQEEQTPGTCQSYENGCCDKDEDCVKGSCFEHICIIEPTEEATVWWEHSHYSEEDHDKVGTYDQLFDGQTARKPDLDCALEVVDIENAGTVTVKATVKVFGVESPCTNLIVTAYTMYDEGDIRSDFSDPDNDDHDASLSRGTVQSEPDENFECHLDLANIPVGKWLVFKSYDINNIYFMDTYQWNVYIKPEEKEDGLYEMDVNAISNTTWQMIPGQADVPNGIQADRGAIAGTIKDCKGQLVKGATIGVSMLPTSLVYFNANVSNLLPYPANAASDKDSTYSAVNQPSGIVRLLSLVKLNGELVKVGEFKIRMLEQSVAIYSQHGPGPMNYGTFVKPSK